MLEDFLVFTGQNILAFNKFLYAYFGVISLFFSLFCWLHRGIFYFRYRLVDLALLSLQSTLTVLKVLFEILLFFKRFFEPVHDFRRRHLNKHLIFSTFKLLNLFQQGMILGL